MLRGYSNIQIGLNPDDWKLVDDHLALFTDEGWKLESASTTTTYSTGLIQVLHSFFWIRED